MPKPNVQPVEDMEPGWFICLDCGATCGPGQRLKHFDGCTPGEAEKWERYYADGE